MSGLIEKFEDLIPAGYRILAMIIILIMTHGFVAYKSYEFGKSQTVNADNKAIVEEVKKDAQDWSDRPRTDDDVVKRLRDAANRRRKNNP